MMILENHDKTPPPLPPPANHHQNQNYHKNSATTASIPKLEMSKNSEDGFYWRKYGQKHVKGSEYPRSYYKCTNTNCPVTKKVERSHDGHIAEIVYKGSHNHPQPKQMMMAADQAAALSSAADHHAAGDDDDVDHAMDGTAANSSHYLNDFPDPPTFSGEEAGDGCSEGASLPEDAADAESEAAKKRKRDGEVVPRSTSREPKVVVQLESEVDILDDGYRWRKYGQKVVKGNPNPRSYYKCTTPNCPVRKHVERAADDIKSVITTYEGKHTHLVPSGTKGAGSSINSSETPGPVASTKAAGKQVQDLPLYLDRKPMQLNYSTSLPPALGSGGGGDLNFGVSSHYPLPFPPFHSMPNFPIKTYSKIYADYMPMPMSMPMQMPMSMPMPTSSPSSSSSHLPPFHYGGDAQPSTQVKPKEEQDEVYDNCLNIPNPPNGTM